MQGRPLDPNPNTSPILTLVMGRFMFPRGGLNYGAIHLARGPLLHHIKNQRERASHFPAQYRIPELRRADQGSARR